MTEEWLVELSAEMRGRIVEGMGEILGRVDADIAGRKPVCQASGRCCKFEEYGHWMLVTGLELVYFWAKLAPPPLT